MAVGPPGALSAASRPWRTLQPRRGSGYGGAAAAPRRRAAPPACRCGLPPAERRQPSQQAAQPFASADEEDEEHDSPAAAAGSAVAPVNGHARSGRPLLGAFGADAPLELDEQAPARAPQAPGAPVLPDLELPPPPGGGPIYVFGCVHGESDGPHMARFILERCPHSVVVETAANPWHGSATGNVLTREEALRQHSDHRTRGWAQLGIQLASWAEGKEPPAPTSPLGSPLWRDLSAGAHRLWSEHLVYVAAFATGAALVFGDRPKRVTYHRLLWCPSVEELDAAYGMQSALNYHELVSTLRPFNDPGNTNCVHRVLIRERDATLCHALHEASLAAGPGRCVVGVVGASHLVGMRHLWEDGAWRGVLAGGDALRMPDIDAVRAAEPPQRLGVRWALFRAVLRLTCRPDVIRDVRAVVGPVPPDLRPVYSLAAELYGSSRMLLAVLDEDQLAEVCQGWQCNFYDVLAPLRAARPVNGGSGVDEDLVLELRTLQFMIGPPDEPGAGGEPGAGDGGSSGGGG